MRNAIIIFLTALVLGAFAHYLWIQNDQEPVKTEDIEKQHIDVGNSAEKSDQIRLKFPEANSVVKSPLVIEGEARGNWYFEASFPVTLLDGNGKILARAPAQAQSDWMTVNFVPFKVGLKFDQPATATGFLVLEKDNSSGEPKFDDELRIPVKFK